MSFSRTLGVVNNVSRSRLIIVRIEKPDEIPKLGSKVVDANGDEVGKVIDIIGPVDRPYAVVKPNSYAVLASIKTSTILFYRTTKSKKQTARR